MRITLTIAILCTCMMAHAQTELWSGACNNQDRDAYAVVFNGDGTKLVSRPPGIAGDAESWTAGDTGPWPCQVCNATGVLWS